MSNSIIDFEEPRWFVCHTRPRCEKKFAKLLVIEHFAHYLPLVRSVRHYPKRDRIFMKPLFPSYVFTEIAPTLKQRVYQLDLLVRAIWVDDQPLFLRQIEDVRRVVDSGIGATLTPLIKKGMRVQVASGPLRGLFGMIENPKAPKGIMIAVDVLQQGILVPIPLDNLIILD